MSKIENPCTKAIKLSVQLLQIKVNDLSKEIETTSETPLQHIFDMYSESIEDYLTTLQKVSLIANYPETIEPWKTLESTEINTLIENLEKDLIKLTKMV